MTALETWCLDNRKRLYRFWQKDREPSMCSLGYIVEAVDLGGDALLGFEVVEGDEVVGDHLEFYRLSDIALEWWAKDEKGVID